jgi:LmbE family N-acetylglucosaminyl deacetylase
VTSEKVIVVVAHADDMEFLAGGTVAKMVEGGAEVSEVIVTNNERGSYDLPAGELIERSRREAEEAGAVLGLKSVTFLDYPDGMLADYRFNEIRERIMGQIRRFRPDTLITWDPFAPYETHQDHRITGMAAVEAAGFANLPLYHPEQVETKDDLVTVSLTYHIAKHHMDPNHVEDITGQMDKKVQALLCHRTQMELTLEGIKRSIRATGSYLDVYRSINPKRYETFIDWAVRKHDAQIGLRGGFEFGEAFRLSVGDDLSSLFDEPP